MAHDDDVTTHRFSRRALLGGALGAAAAGTLGASPALAVTSSGPPTGTDTGTDTGTGTGADTGAGDDRGRGRTRGFVTRAGDQLRLDGRPFRFAGTNCYYLHHASHAMVDDVLGDAAAMGLSVVRAWAFIDGAPSNGHVLQPAPYTYDEAGFEPLDHAVWRAGQLGLRLVLALTNNWEAFGGIDTYVAWFGLADHDDFYRDARAKDAYRAWVRHVIGRRNRYTGLRYDQDPTVMTWELANEPRARSDRSGDTLVAWADEMSRYVKRLAPRQLVAVGDEGFYGRPGDADYPYSDYEGVAWPRLATLPAVDHGTVHCYPDAWKGELSADAKVAWGTRWITDHVADGHRLGVPVVVEEFGLQDPSADHALRDRAYAAWTGAVEAGGGTGDQFWLLTAHQDDGTLYPDYDGFRVVYPSSTATLLAAHARRMAARARG